MQDNMVERVARAIEDSWLQSTAADGWEKVARAAIAAIREPTEAMKIAGEVISDPGFSVSRSDVADIWRHMIDAALQEDAADAR